MPTLHSKLGASGAYRWLECPGSIALCEKAGEGPTSRYAAEGTAAHAVCEWALLNQKDPEALMGWWVDGNEVLYKTQEEAEAGGHEFIFEVDDDMVEATRVYFKYVSEVYEAFEIMGEDPEMFVEKGFDLSFISPGMFGTNDSCVFSPGRTLTVVDYKHGAGKVVEVENNSQLLYYALGALRELCWEPQDGGWNERTMPDTVTIVVVQPRALHPDGPVREWTVSSDYIIHDFAEMLKAGAEATKKPNADRRAGNWCQFCSAKVICPEYEEMVTTPMALAFTEDDFDDVLEMTDKEAKARGRERGKMLAAEGPERLAAILAIEPMFSAMVEAARAAALEAAKGGQDIKGFKVVRKNHHRAWIDPARVVEDLAIAIGEDALYERKLKSPSKLEAAGYGPFIEDLWHKPQGSLTIAPETDKRPGISFFDDQDLVE